MVKIMCQECGYRFEAKNLVPGKKCPYCGRDKLMEEPDAQDLIEEDWN